MEPEKRMGLHQVDLGILGGTGLYEIDGIKIIEEIFLETPFGKPSDAFIIGELGGKQDCLPQSSWERTQNSSL